MEMTAVRKWRMVASAMAIALMPAVLLAIAAGDGGLERTEAEIRDSRAPRPLVIAHRGGDRLRPENTLLAFRYALGLGVDVLEMDIRRTSDGKLVVFHDARVDRTTDGAGLLQEMPLTQVKSLDAGYRWSSPVSDRRFPYRGRGLRVPTLEEVFQTFPQVPMIVEIKPREPQLVESLASLLERFERWDRTVVASFHGVVLKAARRRFPRMITSASPAEVRNFWILTRIGLGRFYPGDLNALQVPEYYGKLHIADERFVRSAQRLAIPVQVWTVNENVAMRRLMSLGVDGIITGRPDRLLKLKKKLGYSPTRTGSSNPLYGNR